MAYAVPGPGDRSWCPGPGGLPAAVVAGTPVAGFWRSGRKRQPSGPSARTARPGAGTMAVLVSGFVFVNDLGAEPAAVRDRDSLLAGPGADRGPVEPVGRGPGGAPGRTTGGAPGRLDEGR